MATRDARESRSNSFERRRKGRRARAVVSHDGLETHETRAGSLFRSIERARRRRTHERQRVARHRDPIEDCPGLRVDEIGGSEARGCRFNVSVCVLLYKFNLKAT